MSIALVQSFDVASGDLATRIGALADDTLRGIGDQVDALGVRDADAAAELISSVEQLRRRVDAFTVDVLTAVENQCAHYDDGHASAKIMMRHLGRLSGAEAAGRDRCRRMFAALDDVASSYRRGEVGTDQVRLLSRVWSNPRVRDAMVDKQSWFLELAARLSYPKFERRVRRWEELVDTDGADPGHAHNRRNAQLTQNFDTSWDLQGRYGSLDGAAMKPVFDAYVQAEFEADWQAATDLHGNAACADDLARTPSQRRADALKAIFADAAANRGGPVSPGFVHNVVWSDSTYREMADRFSGQLPKPFDVDNFRCETLNADPLEPYEAFASSLWNQVRRVVVDAKSTVIDLGTARLFTGNARTAVQLSASECYWPGCWVPVDQCEIDHLTDHSRGGRTHPGNGAPACGRHNRWKQKGYRVTFDAHGKPQIHRPDGQPVTEVARAPTRIAPGWEVPNQPANSDWPNQPCSPGLGRAKKNPPPIGAM